MPRIAMATSVAERIADSDDEASTTRVDDLIQRGRSQGHLSLAELRTAFGPGRTHAYRGTVHSARELSEVGVRLANELAQAEPARTEPAGTKGSSRAVRRAPRPRVPPSRLVSYRGPGLARRTMPTWPTTL